MADDFPTPAKKNPFDLPGVPLARPGGIPSAFGLNVLAKNFTLDFAG